MNRVITCAFWRRPNYTEQVLSALSKCDGIESYTLFIHLDAPGEDANAKKVLEVVRGITFAPYHIVLKSHHLGCNRNTYEALNHGFTYDDYVIHIEDDILLAPDAIRFFEWGRAFGDRKDILSVSVWPHLHRWVGTSGTPKPAGHDQIAALSDLFHSWGWATWKDRWLEMKENWSTQGDHELSWDHQIHTNVRNGRKCITPLTGRCQNIGAEAGTHRGDCILEYWAGSPNFQPGTHYQLADPL